MLVPGLVCACMMHVAVAATAATTGAPGGSGECPGPADTGDEDWPGQRQWRQLEAAGYRLGELRVEVRDVYVGPRLAWYQRLANSLHRDTDPGVVRDLLTVGTGDRVEADRIYEAERILRGQPFLTAARIVPVACADGRVAAEVRVRDAWTLQVGAGVGAAGGESTSTVGFKDENFLGSGKAVLLDWSEDSERTTLEFGYEDPSLFGTSWTLGLSHRELSDGRGDAASIGYPFRRADQVWGFRAYASDARSSIDFEVENDTAFSADVDREEADIELRRLVAQDAEGGWRVGLGWRRDYAAYGALEEEQAGLRPPPELVDRRLQGPYISLERFNDRYKSFRNLRAIGKTEDYDLGFDARLSVGRYAQEDGPDDPWFFGINVEHGLAIGPRDLLLSRIGLSGRYREGSGREAWYRSLGADYYHRTSQRNTIVLHGEYDWRDEMDPEDELYLGGFDGLLAYPDRFRVGDRRWRLHLEDRYVSDIVLFDTIQVGYTAYLEAGRMRTLDNGWGRTLADVGFGLRLGSLRSSFGSVSYLTVAVPLVDAGQEDEYSVVVGSTVSF